MKSHLSSYPALTAAFKTIDLSDKSVLITGGAYGIGAFIAKAFAAGSASHIILVGRTESRLKDAVASLASISSTKFEYRVADISSMEDIQQLFASLEVSPDILINNAGYLPDRAPFVDGDFREWWRGFEVNVFGTAFVTQTYLRHRRGLGRGGMLDQAVVISLNTFGAHTVRFPELSAYGISKAALARWNEFMAADVPASEARFVSVHPGNVKTDMQARTGLSGLEMTDGQLIGEFVLWLTTADAAFLTGRFVWVNWDIEELLRRKEEILSQDLLIAHLSQ